MQCFVVTVIQLFLEAWEGGIKGTYVTVPDMNFTRSRNLKQNVEQFG